MKCSRCGAIIPAGQNACQACGSAVQVLEGEGLAPGTVIAGKYSIADQIGAGGMGRVYRAIQSPLDTEVCIKTLHQGASADQAFPLRFEREAKTTSRLRHPNIVSVIDFGAHVDGSLYLVMEYVSGTSLADITGKDHMLPAARTVSILGQLCDALSAAHAMGVIHRDLKPANIMLQDMPDGSDFVKVLDFGSALLVDDSDEDARLTQVGTVIGTPAYMAPEHILGRGLDARVDVYAVGVLLYKLLCGVPPFRGNTQALLAQHVSVHPELPSRRHPDADVSIQMERVIMRALVKDPARRYGTAAELKEAMEDALRGVLDDDFDIHEPVDGRVGVEMAAEDRAVIVATVRGAYKMRNEDTTRVTALGQAYGALVEARDDDSVNMIFGLGHEGAAAAADAAKCATEMVGKEEQRPIRVGIHDAQASCRGQQGAPGFHYELYGDGEGLAAALSTYAAPGQVLVSGNVARHVATSTRLVPVRPPAGHIKPVFQVTDLAASGGLPKQLGFVGRRLEQRALVELAVDAKQGGCGVVLGSEGVGKSRLVAEVASQVAKLDVQWVVVRADGQTQPGPTNPASLVAALGWNTSQGLGSAAERHAVDLMLGRTSEATDALRGERRQLRYISAALAGLSRRLQQGPTVVVLDDLHLADDLTWALARRLVETGPAMGFMPVLCLRSEVDLPIPLPKDRVRIKLAPLGEMETLSLIRSGLGGKADEAAALNAVGSAQGHPLLALEILRTVNAGQASLLDGLAGLSTEQAMTELITRRVGALSQQARRIVCAAAVLGEAPSQAELLEFGDAFQDLNAFVELESRGVLRRSAHGTLQFPFARMRQVVLSLTPPRQLAGYHRQAATIVAHSARAADRRLELGRHLFDAGMHAQAFDALRRAAESAQYDGELRSAARCLELAEQAGQHLDAVREPDRIAVVRDHGELLIQMGHIKEAELLLREASMQARAVGAAELSADLLRLHGKSMVLMGDPQSGREEIEATLAFAEKRGDLQTAVKSCVDLVEAAEKSGDGEGMSQILEHGLSLLEGREGAELMAERIQLYNRLARQALQQGNVTRAIATFAQALDLAEKHDDSYQAAGLLGNLGGAYAQQQETAKALHYTERALRASEDLGDFLGIARQSFNLALLRLSAGQADSARDLLESAREAAGRAAWAEGLAMTQAAIAKLDTYK